MLLLINPLSSGGDPHMFAPGIGYITAYLETKNIPVFVIDRNIHVHKKKMDIRSSDNNILDAVKALNPSHVGLAFMTPNLFDVRHCAKLIGDHSPSLPIILGGTHPTFEYKSVFDQVPHASIAVRGPGEYVLEKILAGTPLAEIPNIVYCEGSQTVETHVRKMYRKEELSIDYTKWDFDLYWDRFTPLFNGLDVEGVTYLMSSQGCPGHCTFCVDDRFLGGGFFHSNDFVLDEMEILFHHHGRRVFVFLDRVFRRNPKAVIEFCKEKIERGLKGIPWYAPFRVEFITEESAFWLKEAGCFQLNIGFESGSQSVLDRLNKKSTVEQNFRACEILEKNKICFASAFIYGLPGQTLQDMESNLEFFNSFTFFDASANQLLPLPGSPIYKELVAQGRLNPNTDSYFDDVKSVGKPIDAFNFSDVSNDFYKKLFTEHAVHFFETCKTNRALLIKRYNLEKIFKKREK